MGKNKTLSHIESSWSYFLCKLHVLSFDWVTEKVSLWCYCVLNTFLKFACLPVCQEKRCLA